MHAGGSSTASHPAIPRRVTREQRSGDRPPGDLLTAARAGCGVHNGHVVRRPSMKELASARKRRSALGD